MLLSGFLVRNWLILLVPRVNIQSRYPQTCKEPVVKNYLLKHFTVWEPYYGRSERARSLIFSTAHATSAGLRVVVLGISWPVRFAWLMLRCLGDLVRGGMEVS